MSKIPKILDNKRNGKVADELRDNLKIIQIPRSPAPPGLYRK